MVKWQKTIRRVAFRVGRQSSTTRQVKVEVGELEFKKSSRRLAKRTVF